jgi:hypothetical protein
MTLEASPSLIGEEMEKQENPWANMCLHYEIHLSFVIQSNTPTIALQSTKTEYICFMDGAK